MSGYNPITLESTIPTIDTHGIAHFDLTVTLAGTPPSGATIILSCTPSTVLVLNNPYTFSSAVGTIPLSSIDAITQQVSVTIQVTADNASLCRQVTLSPPGTTSPAGNNVTCPGV